jgi:GH15 family glucan-1,4-alpha-glucosidase
MKGDRAVTVQETAEIPIADYAMIGDTRTAALIAKSGSVDWMCLPRFDGLPIFGRLVDRASGGSFSISFLEADETRRFYRPGSAVMETTVKTSSGEARLVEGMVANVAGALLPQTLLVRRVECTSGKVLLRVLFDPRRGFPGSPPDRTRKVAPGRMICEWGSLAVSLDCSPAAMIEPGRMIEPGSETELAVGATRSLTLVMSVADRSPVVWVPSSEAEQLLEDTDRWWRAWSNGLDYEGPFREAIVRSLITLRLLTYSPSGAPVAAPTTSLPEAVEGSRNWDYRYAWPRDASIGLAAFLATGQARLATSFLHWLSHASRLSRPRLRILYDVFGKPPADETEVNASGYLRSKPVRLGNGASGQHQLDVYGWVADAAWLLDEAGNPLDGETWRAVAGFADFVAENWRLPDAGIWEVRGKPAQYVHSKLMAWLALDRTSRLARSHRVRQRRLRKWERERDEIASWVRANGIDQRRNTLVWKAGSDELDASLLLLPVLGFESADSSLVTGTIDSVRADLETEPGLLFRYRQKSDGLEGDEGAFLPCSFWLVQALAGTGRVAGATALFEHLLTFANDVGLWSEEIDAISKDLWGNFPQAFTHATVVQAGLALQSADRTARGAS